MSTKPLPAPAGETLFERVAYVRRHHEWATCDAIVTAAELIGEPQ